MGVKERTAKEFKTLVLCLWLSGVYDHVSRKSRVAFVNLLLTMGNGRVMPLFTCLLRSRNPREKGKKGRAAAASSCCGRSTSTNVGSAEQASDSGRSGSKWAAEQQHWVPLFKTFPEVPMWVSSHVFRNSCAGLRQRMCRRQCQERDVERCLESLDWLAGCRDQSFEHKGTNPGATQVLFK